VQKSRLIEKIAELLEAKKLPLLADVRDESAEDVRVVLEPRARTVDAMVLMEQLFKLTELEVRVPLNMNVLSRGQVPVVLGLSEALSEWLAHRKVVLKRRSEYRLSQIEHRLEVLAGYLIAYLNLDEVIRIIRYEDEPKAELIARFKLTEVQAEAILNMRLRALRKLEEIEIQGEHDKLTGEKADIQALLASDPRQWKHIAGEIRETKKRYGKSTEVGRRRSVFQDMPSIDVDVDQAMIDREPVTVVLSEKGWIRALKGHQDDLDKVQFKTGDSLMRAVRAQSTDKIVLFASNGKFYTLDAATLPGGRGHGEPVRLMIDIEEDSEIIELFVHKPGRKLLIAAKSGNGFIIAEDEVVAQTRKGRQIMTVADKDKACVCVACVGDSVAVVGDNRKLLVFPLAEVNELARGRGVRLQRYTDGGLADVTVFTAATGLQWMDGARVRTFTDLAEWLGVRAQAGRTVPKGFPRSNRFSITHL
jgi:topoisomerase-4 subunit A